MISGYYNDIVDSKNINYPYNPENAKIRNPEYHMDINEFFNLTINAMQKVRNLLFSLSFFVYEKEKEKSKGIPGIIPTMEWTIDWDKNPELKKIADDMAEEIKTAQRKFVDDILDTLEKGEFNTNNEN